MNHHHCKPATPLLAKQHSKLLRIPPTTPSSYIKGIFKEQHLQCNREDLLLLLPWSIWSMHNIQPFWDDILNGSRSATTLWLYYWSVSLSPRTCVPILSDSSWWEPCWWKLAFHKEMGSCSKNENNNGSSNSWVLPRIELTLLCLVKWKVFKGSNPALIFSKLQLYKWAIRLKVWKWWICQGRIHRTVEVPPSPSTK